MTESGEVLVALGYAAGAALWLGGPGRAAGWARYVNGGVMLAVLGGALLTANYYLLAGYTLPGLHPAAPFQEGLDSDGLLTLVAIALLATHVRLLWRRPTAGPSRRARRAA